MNYFFTWYFRGVLYYSCMILAWWFLWQEQDLYFHTYEAFKAFWSWKSLWFHPTKAKDGCKNSLEGSTEGPEWLLQIFLAASVSRKSSQEYTTQSDCNKNKSEVQNARCGHSSILWLLYRQLLFSLVLLTLQVYVGSFLVFI